MAIQDDIERSQFTVTILCSTPWRSGKGAATIEGWIARAARENGYNLIPIVTQKTGNESDRNVPQGYD